MTEEQENVKEFLEHFETEIYPIFQTKGYIKNLALQVYAMYCFNGTAIIDNPNEDEEWKRNS